MPPLPQPTATQIPTLAQTATPSPTSDSCPGFVIEGFARGTTGGCGGSVYTVTTLEDPATAVPGTFRYGVENLSGKRIIKFGVSGTLALRKDISIRNGDLTIDGSNAPGAGVQFSGGTLIVEASNVILRHLRILVGPYSQNPGKADNIRIAGERGFWVENVVVDHCSLQWATDENLSITGMARNVTVQWSIVAEGLYLSTHGKVDPHSMGALFHHDATRMTLHHNLFAHNNYRNPQLASRGTLEWINNVVYNTRSAAGILQTPEVGDENWLDAIGNFNKMGPNSDWAGARFRYSWREGVVLGISHLFVQGNFDWNRTSPLQEERAVVAPYLWKWLSSTRLVTGSEVAITSAAQAYEDVLAGAGATAPCRSPVDKRIIQETQQGAGGFINYPSERGGWPDLTQGCS
jgi:pectate lyase